MTNEPVAYFITLETHGGWMYCYEDRPREQAEGTFDNARTSRDADDQRRERVFRYVSTLKLTAPMRALVDTTIREVCVKYRWTLRELGVGATGVRMVLSAPVEPAHVHTSVEAWTIRRLRAARLVAPTQRVWSLFRGSRPLWRVRAVRVACALARRVQTDA